MTLSRFAVAAILTVAFSATASAQVANGRYQIGGCTTNAVDTVVQLENNVLSFFEATCTLANPLPIDGTNGFSYLGQCAGEAEEWQANMMLIPMDGGMRMINDGVIQDFARCEG